MSSAINDTSLSFELAELIMRWYRPGQKMAVGKPEYKGIIERTLVCKATFVCLCLWIKLDPILLPFLSGYTVPV